MSAWLAPGEIIIAMGFAGHDPQENEHDNRNATEHNERRQETPENRQRDHRFVTTLLKRPEGDRAEGDRHLAAQVAGDTSVGCKAPDMFGVTLRSDL